MSEVCTPYILLADHTQHQRTPARAFGPTLWEPYRDAPARALLQSLPTNTPTLLLWMVYGMVLVHMVHTYISAVPAQLMYGPCLPPSRPPSRPYRPPYPTTYHRLPALAHK